ncbi:MAG: PKD domain-containing protein, partial [Bacteroidota bacterium]|nr:PKD domain-containing protein [Bacteroidota bacterium]
MRKTIILISLIVAGFMGTTLAQGNFVISGTVTGATTGQSIPNHVVNAIDSIAGTMLTTTTDANGMYSFTTTVQPGTQTMIIVTTMGFCGPNDFYAQVVIPPFMGGGATADFVICETSTNNNCQADFTYTNNIISGGINTTVDFYDTSSAGTGTITSWTWDFGDGNTSTLQDPTHVYASAGFYQVCLDIFTSDSCSSFFCDYILVGDSFPTNNCQADFFYTNFQTPTGNNNTVEFIDYSFSSAGTIVSWAWDFGDGNSSTLQDPTHVYASAGFYQVCLEIFTSDSCSSTYCENIVVNVFNPSNCQAMFYYGMSSVSPDAFTDASWATGNILTWTWDFGDGSTSTDQNPIHQFASSGYYNVCLDITTDSGCTSSYCEYILYYNSAGCSADFYSYSNNPGGYGLDYTFQDMSYGNVIEWTWDFGDGTTSTLQNPTHTYSAYGVYNVCLSIFTSDSCTSTACYDVYAIDSTSTGCNAYFAYGGTGGIMLPGVFVDGSTSTGNILAWFWSFGDGAYSTDQNPTHYYASSGYYNVCLDIVTDNGCADTYCDTIYYDSTGVSWCNANFDYVFNPSINCVYGYDFTDFSTASGNILSWTWDFDDGTTSTDQNPVHCFSATGVYHVCLEIMTDDSCTSSYCNYIH